MKRSTRQAGNGASDVDGDSLARGLVSGAQHFLNRPFASRHRVTVGLAAAAGGHFMNLPCVSLQRTVVGLAAGAGFDTNTARGGHFTNFPWTSLHGAAASAGVAKKIATPAASNSFRFIVHPLEPFNRRGDAIRS
ncbi:hypothetical protein U1839_05995 [Sphingomonas sp. RT2P30]|uniref:hypothetical protein n=1 Tax=Parasphingomonas halimpatiens TaxID=3096162 RepID=UPI002FCC35D7